MEKCTYPILYYSIPMVSQIFICPKHSPNLILNALRNENNKNFAPCFGNTGAKKQISIDSQIPSSENQVLLTFPFPKLQRSPEGARLTLLFCNYKTCLQPRIQEL